MCSLFIETFSTCNKIVVVSRDGVSGPMLRADLTHAGMVRKEKLNNGNILALTQLDFQGLLDSELSVAIPSASDGRHGVFSSAANTHVPPYPLLNQETDAPIISLIAVMHENRTPSSPSTRSRRCTSSCSTASPAPSTARSSGMSSPRLARAPLAMRFYTY